MAGFPCGVARLRPSTPWRVCHPPPRRFRAADHAESGGVPNGRQAFPRIRPRSAPPAPCERPGTPRTSMWETDHPDVPTAHPSLSTQLRRGWDQRRRGGNFRVIATSSAGTPSGPMMSGRADPFSFPTNARIPVLQGMPLTHPALFRKGAGADPRTRPCRAACDDGDVGERSGDTQWK